MTFQHCRSLRTLMVMLVSSVWHGVHPGYYLSLGSVPFCLMVSITKYVPLAVDLPQLINPSASVVIQIELNRMLAVMLLWC